MALPGNSEEMAQFFNARATDYEQHMKESVEDFALFYRSIADSLPELCNSPEILDLGVGTGLELDRLFERFPNASVTGIDISVDMLDELARKDRQWIPHLTLVAASFLELDLGGARYDAIISSMALHHWPPHVKLNLYRRIHNSLRPGGAFVNGDYVDSEENSILRLAKFAASETDECHQQHIDLPLSPEQEKELLKEAGFRNTGITFQRTRVCVFRASKL